MMLMARGELKQPPILKGRPPLRQCPADFRVIFVEQGREACEAWYRARKTTITRWLEECGKEKLIRERAAFVAHQRRRRFSLIDAVWIAPCASLVDHDHLWLAVAVGFIGAIAADMIGSNL